MAQASLVQCADVRRETQGHFVEHRFLDERRRADDGEAALRIERDEFREAWSYVDCDELAIIALGSP